MNVKQLIENVANGSDPVALINEEVEGSLSPEAYKKEHGRAPRGYHTDRVTGKVVSIPGATRKGSMNDLHHTAHDASDKAKNSMSSKLHKSAEKAHRVAAEKAKAAGYDDLENQHTEIATEHHNRAGKLQMVGR